MRHRAIGYYVPKITITCQRCGANHVTTARNCRYCERCQPIVLRERNADYQRQQAAKKRTQ